MKSIISTVLVVLPLAGQGFVSQAIALTPSITDRLPVVSHSTPLRLAQNESAEAFLNRGTQKIYGSGDLRGAIADLTQAIQIDPNCAEAYNNRGIAHAGLGDKQEAIADYSRAIEINPNFAEAYYNQGNTLADLGDNQGAIADFTKAIQINPNLVEAYIYRSVARAALGDKQGAIADLQQAAKLFQAQDDMDSYKAMFAEIERLRSQ